MGMEHPGQMSDFILPGSRLPSEEQEQLAYWKKQLAGAPDLLQLPTDRLRPPVQTFSGATLSFEITKSLTEALRMLSNREQVTLFMTLFAAFETLLHRYTGQDDIVLGTSFDNRSQQTERLIGPVANRLPLRNDLSGNPSFRELLRRVRTVVSEAYAYRDLPFELLVEEVQTRRDLSHTPLFQVMFVFQVGELGNLRLSDLNTSPLSVGSKTAQFDLTLKLVETSDALKGYLEYNSDLFDETTMKRMEGHFLTLLSGIIAHPEQHISTLPILTQAEQRQLLADWNDTKADYPADTCIHSVFEAQAKRTPDAIAVVFTDIQLTYHELNCRANRLAYRLQSMGVKPEVFVGICVERSLETIIGLLAVLKAGGAYVPLDPNYPKERLSLMLRDTHALVVLTQRRLIGRLPKHGAQVVCLDDDLGVPTQEDERNLQSGASAENLTYVIYTSGSTGIPKGVAMSHRSLANFISWQVQEPTLAHEARTLQFASLNFDVSFQEIFSTLWSGGTLVMISEELRRDVLSLWRFLVTEGFERLFIPSIVLQQLAEVANSEESIPIGLHEIITSGEQLQITPQIESFFRRLRSCTLHNQYGPSENHGVTSLPLPSTRDAWPVLPPIGRVISNVQVYLLDAYLAPVPIGVPGELYVGGLGLARGYLNRPEMTAERFLPNPFGDKVGSRLYRTGDLARYRADGTIDFLGRIDNQVKIRGFRIELGEIEAVLAHHPGVQDVVVVTRQDSPAEKRLVAYVVPASEKALAVSELRTFLQEKLPNYMIPAAFVLLEALPLTPNGKVDRQVLPPPQSIHMQRESAYRAPRTEIETILASIWSRVLNLERVAIDDNFFDLGGNSLLATQLALRIRDALNIELPLQSLFEAPILADLAATIEVIRWAAQAFQVDFEAPAHGYEENEL